jgi:hypothetical protein
MYCLLGLDLLRLLSQNRISEFHTALERIEPSQLSNVYIKHPIQLEQWLMEGSYNKVWNSRVDVPAPEYGFFIDILMSTIRYASVLYVREREKMLTDWFWNNLETKLRAAQKERTSICPLQMQPLYCILRIKMSF